MGPRFLLILTLITLSVPLSSRGQSVENSQVGRFQLAESFLRAAQFERAIGLLEGLFEESPGVAGVRSVMGHRQDGPGAKLG